MTSTSRCEDCLDEFQPGGRIFVVLKRMRDLPPDTDPREVRILDNLCFDQVFICEDCAGWYGDHSIDVTDEVLR
jgi:hypothetical protein